MRHAPVPRAGLRRSPLITAMSGVGDDTPSEHRPSPHDRRVLSQLRHGCHARTLTRRSMSHWLTASARSSCRGKVDVMTGQWQGSSRAARLPSNWKTLRLQAKRRAHGKCQWMKANGETCKSWGAECDHIVAGDDHSLPNLQWLCTVHHRIKTQAEARAAQAAVARPSRLRPVEPHPGLIRRPISVTPTR